MTKRAFDLFFAAAGLVFLAPLLAAIALLVKYTSTGPVIFRQTRVGRRFRPFVIYKFRTMTAAAPALGPELTVGDDPRITRAGKFLRATKLDELPQLYNVLVGDMSFVGPRPEVERYVAAFRQDYEAILQIRPGITDLASLKYRHEAAVLATAADPEAQYLRHILPEKIALAKEYLHRSSVWFDLLLIVRTVAACWPVPAGKTQVQQS